MTAAVALSLDTAPPVLAVLGPTEATPPDEVVIEVVASEVLGFARVTLTDTLRSATAGVEWTGARSFRVVVPTESLAGGTGEVVIEAADLVCNRTLVRHRLHVHRPRPYDVRVTIGGSVDVEVSVDRALEVDVALGRSYDVPVTVDRLYEATVTPAPTYDVALEVSGGQS